ncbi:MAG: energy transducer TonB, partial [Desulfocapsa sp.]|nr:energy transducer TonB [Desulfocapsa sp.]
TLSVLVSKEGKADMVRIHTSSGHALLDTSARKTVKSWRFLPGIEADQPVAMEVLVPIHFKLH